MSTRPRPTPTRARPVQPARGLSPWVPVGILALVVVVIAIGFLAGRSDDDTQTGTVEYVGEPLPPRPSAGPDPAIGLPVGEVRGTDPDGDAVVFASGAPRALMFLAHWCGHCQAELDAINGWLAAGNQFPGEVEIQVIATWSDAGRPNHPPGDWLMENDWTHPTILDDGDFTLATAMGLSGTPMWIFVDADGTVRDRTGALAPEDLAARLDALAASST